MNNYAPRFFSKLVFAVLALANTACEMNIASNNQILSNNLNGQGLPQGGANINPAGATGLLAPNGAPILPRSIDIAAEQARARNVINTMAVHNNPFAEVLAQQNGPPSQVVASYQPATAPQPQGAVQAGITAPAVQGRAPTSVAQQSPTPPSYSGGGGQVLR